MDRREMIGALTAVPFLGLSQGTLPGEIVDARIYDRELRPAEVRALAGSPSRCPKCGGPLVKIGEGPLMWCKETRENLFRPDDDPDGPYCEWYSSIDG